MGDSYVWSYNEDPPASVEPGPPGPNQTWDFTGLTEDFESSADFVDPSTTPFAGEFPSSNLATNTDDTVFSYLDKNTDMATSLGVAIQSSTTDPIIFHNVPGEILADFPVNYQDEWEQQYYSEYYIATGQPGIDSMRYKSDVTKQVEVDAWGTVTIPLGTFNALRVYVVENTVDSTWFKIGGIWMFQFASSNTYMTYEWWTNEPPVSPFLASMSMDGPGREVTDVTWVKQAFVGVEEKGDMNAAAVFPNPARDHFMIRAAEPGIYDISVFDNTGKPVATGQTNSRGELRINTSTFGPGIYTYQMINSRSAVLSSGKIIIE